jgi:hypothetical protein
MSRETPHMVAGHCEARDLAILRLGSMKALNDFSQPFGNRSFRKICHCAANH